MSFRYIELFAGIGGFRLGLDAVGGTHVFANERDKYAAQTYAAWFGDESLVVGDMHELDYRKEIPPHDLLCGGFPCQPFSIAGVSKKNSLGRKHGFEDVEQGNLFFEIMKIASIHKPKIIFLENVKNLIGHDKGNTWKVINESLDSLGYVVKFQIINASSWVPQNRRRVFIVAMNKQYFDKDLIDKFEFPQPSSLGPNLKTILHRNPPDEKYMLSDALWRYLRNYARAQREKGNGFGYKLFSGEDVAATMSARYYKDGAEILISQPGWKNPRKLTPKEAAKLMGFNSRFARNQGYSREFPIIVSDVQAYKQFGNAVCPPVVESIAAEIKRVYELQKMRHLKTGSTRKAAV
jgi:DNA (cytosine-5)-methyltransferase 1